MPIVVCAKKKTKLYYMRMSAGLTRREMSKRTGISESFISRLENHERRINEDHIRAVAKALDMTPKAVAIILFEDEVPMKYSGCSLPQLQTKRSP